MKNRIDNKKEIFEKEAQEFNHIRAMYFESKSFENYWQNRRREKILDSLKKLKENCFSVLDIGCAEGYFLEEAKKMGYTAKGIEISEGKKNKGIANGLDIISGNAENLPFADKSYDIVMLNRILELLPDDFKALSEAKRVAKKFLIITVPKGKDRNDIHTYSWGVKRRSYNHQELKDILTEQGKIFELKCLCPLGFFPYGIGRLFQRLKLYKFRLTHVLDILSENIFRLGNDIFILVSIDDLSFSADPFKLDGFLDEFKKEKVLQYIKGSVLDVGCNDGQLVNFINSIGKKSAGIDYDYNLIKIAKNRFPALEFKVASMESIPYKDLSFNTCVAWNILEHLEDDEKGLKELLRVAKNNVILTVPKEDEISIPSGVTYRHYIDPTHKHYYTTEKLKELIKNSNGEIIHMETISRAHPLLAYAKIGIPLIFCKILDKIFWKISKNKDPFLSVYFLVIAKKEDYD
ncbi:MAG: class I SAM-dependent methyltransferase [Candidatus Staskawiczbacteria bacterium]|nr:class I SAM-dependent methyltransferase [Candidatus Staskawiczbacteria bacterium]